MNRPNPSRRPLIESRVRPDTLTRSLISIRSRRPSACFTRITRINSFELRLLKTSRFNQQINGLLYRGFVPLLPHTYQNARYFETTPTQNCAPLTLTIESTALYDASTGPDPTAEPMCIWPPGPLILRVAVGRPIVPVTTCRSTRLYTSVGWNTSSEMSASRSPSVMVCREERPKWFQKRPIRYDSFTPSSEKWQPDWAPPSLDL